MKKIKEIELDGERVFLRKRLTGYKEVHPIRIDGKFNWKNFLIGGSWMNVLKLIILIILISLIALSYYHDQAEFRELQENPCEYAAKAQVKCFELNRENNIFPTFALEG